jgi:hypothetical protein
MCFDALRFAVTALAFRSDVANFLKPAAPADRAGCADTKTFVDLSTGQATLNHCYNPLAKINRKRPGHAC